MTIHDRAELLYLVWAAPLLVVAILALVTP
jgi:hypothetical protein